MGIGESIQESNKDKLTIDKRKLPLVAPTLAMAILTFIMFAFTWKIYEIKGGETPLIVNASFYKLAFFNVPREFKDFTNVLALLAFIQLVVLTIITAIHALIDGNKLSGVIKVLNITIFISILFVILSSTGTLGGVGIVYMILAVILITYEWIYSRVA